MTRAPYPNCPACGEHRFYRLPGLAFPLLETAAAGLRKRTGGSTYECTAIVCAGCGRTDLFTSDAAELAGRVPGASSFEAVPPGSR